MLGHCDPEPSRLRRRATNRPASRSLAAPRNIRHAAKRAKTPQAYRACGVFFSEGFRRQSAVWVGGWWVAACLRSEDLSELFANSSLLAVPQSRCARPSPVPARSASRSASARGSGDRFPRSARYKLADVARAVAAFDRQIAASPLIFAGYRRRQHPHVPVRAMQQDLRRHRGGVQREIILPGRQFRAVPNNVIRQRELPFEMPVPPARDWESRKTSPAREPRWRR